MNKLIDNIKDRNYTVQQPNHNKVKNDKMWRFNEKKGKKQPNINLVCEEPRHPRHEFLTAYIILHIEYINFRFINILYL